MRTRRKLLIAGLLAAVLAASPQSATTAALAPAKPSQIVTLKSGPNDCPALGKAVDLQILPDGTFHDFAIPANQVLVITEVDWGVVFAPASQAVVLALAVQAPSTSASLPFFIDVAVTDSAGTAGKISPVAHAIVRSGNSLCVAGGTAVDKSVIVRGFLTKDR